MTETSLSLGQSKQDPVPVDFSLVQAGIVNLENYHRISNRLRPLEDPLIKLDQVSDQLARETREGIVFSLMTAGPASIMLIGAFVYVFTKK